MKRSCPADYSHNMKCRICNKDVYDNLFSKEYGCCIFCYWDNYEFNIGDSVWFKLSPNKKELTITVSSIEDCFIENKVTKDEFLKLKEFLDRCSYG